MNSTLEELHITSPSGKTESLYVKDFATQEELQNYAAKLYNLILHGVDYFYIESLHDNNIITFNGYHLGGKSNQIEYSINNEWNSLLGVSQISLNNGDKVYLRCIDGNICRTNTDNQKAIFDTTFEFNLGGNIEMLLFDYKQLFEKHTYADYSIYSFFRGTKVVNSSKLILPATILAPSCYRGMFYNCSSLTTAPELPAMTLADGCYASMFWGCTSLTSAPELPATTLAKGCYEYMFYACSKLNYIKCLATTGVNQNNSTSYWVSGVAPTGTFIKDSHATWSTGTSGIPVGWAVDDGSYITFTAQQGNSSIGLNQLSTNQTLEYSTDKTTWSKMGTYTTIKLANVGDEVYVRGMLSADNTISNYTRFKMSGKIAASGNCNALWNYQDLDAPLKKYCGYNMFVYCTSLTTAPELPATTLNDGCYRSMFSMCSSLTTAPELPATTLANSCYSYMFNGCSSLTTAPKLPATTLTSSCYFYMFQGCTSLTVAPELPATTLAYSCYDSMFYSCDSLTTAPELPATTLANRCYAYMFLGCRALITAPELPATILAENCYNNMFDKCFSLNYIKCLATDISATNCTYNWVESVPRTGTFVKNPSMTSWSTGYNGIPEGWTVENYVEQ